MTSGARYWWLGVLSPLMLVLIASTDLRAQTGGGATDTARAWYDTLEVERPRFARATFGERLALAAFTALALPVGLSVGATTIVPPTFSVLEEDGRRRFGISAGTGWGFGGDTTQFIYFPDARVQFEIGYYVARERPIIVHGSLLKDVRIASIHPRDFFWVALSGGVGVASDIHSTEPYAEAWIGLVNPMGIRFAPLFPMHNYGFRGRLGYDPANNRTWYEISFGLTSTFGF